ncbi:uncharacterized protein LOC108735748 [Agrilus planipennis]|uniref:Uncharacterized protein LOC108735748 n=1 Tax=Agrilus planipennis TaxID=224129 RepID=A0A1W4WTB9_AGRPL|nr:uncharacterized protein LOC108735748 [Agrilus planipennis]XP_018323382.1 uncharacterized protein LOC108735748 [Agrilus planipennis]XP_018323383.1 uncharacterized protein LOC108735748 [Agrilus planipennis]XP_018323384.1 uncharacterized protein LOC108735748 [Agrilus planipennis]
MIDASERFLVNSRFWIQRVLVPIAVFIGVGGNVVSVIVLTRRRMRNSTNVYLTALAVADLIYLFFVLILSFEHYPNIHDIKYSLFWRFYGISHWFCDAASSTSVWLTVSFTIERYVAVCHPIRGKVLCTERRAKTIIWIISLLCFVFTATTPLEHQLKLEKICIQKMCTANNNNNNVNNNNNNNNGHRDTESLIASVVPNTSFTIQNNISPNDSSEWNCISEVLLNNITKEQNGDSVKNVLKIKSERNKDLLTITAKKNSFQPENNNNTNETSNSAHPDWKRKKQARKKGESNLILEYPEEENANNNETNCNDNENGLLQTFLFSGELTDDQYSNETIENFTSTADADKELYVPSYFMKENETCCYNTSYIDTELTKLGKNKTYQKVYYWFSSIVFGLLPLVLIATFNCFLVNAVYKSQKQRKVMTNSQDQMSQSQENRITLLLIGVVVLFLVCQTPTASFLIYDAFDETKDTYSRNIKKGLGNIFNFLITLNASCNFILYCVLSDKFRRTFKIVFCSRGLSRQDTLITLTGGSRTASQRFHSQRNLIKRGTSEYVPRTPRNLETQSLNSIPRTKSLLQRQLGKAKTRDLHV